MMSLGFLTFGGATAGFVLNNYASSDSLITVARLAVGLSIITGYPFVFSALREGVMDMMKVTDLTKRSSMQGKLTLSLLSMVTLLSLVLKDVGFVVSVSGAAFGSALMLMFPAMMNIRNIKARAAADGKTGRALTKAEDAEIILNNFITATGALLAVLGVGISVLKEMKKL
jgi:Transmembrane amino acid transporter protein